MDKDYGELDKIVRWAAYVLGTTADFDGIVGGIRALRTKVKQLEKKLAEYEPVLPTETEELPELPGEEG